MLQFSTWKQVAIILTCVIGVLLVVPNFLSKETLDSLPRWVPKTQLSLGLDLRGGAHLLLSMETADVRKDWLETLRDDARRRTVSMAALMALLTRFCSPASVGVRTITPPSPFVTCRSVTVVPSSTLPDC
jgi:preprotein translocase subunit SecD